MHLEVDKNHCLRWPSYIFTNAFRCPWWECRPFSRSIPLISLSHHASYSVHIGVSCCEEIGVGRFIFRHNFVCCSCQEYVYVYIYRVKWFVEHNFFKESLKQFAFLILILDDCPPVADSDHSSQSECFLHVFPGLHTQK